MARSFRLAFIEALQNNFDPLKKVLPKPWKDFVRKALSKDQREMVDLGHGAKVSLRLDDGYWSAYAGDIKKYEPEMWDVANRYFTPNTVFVDGGANAGLWSVVAASRIRNKDQVIAVEAGRGILPETRRNNELNGNSFTILEKALWETSGETMDFTASPLHASNGLQQHTFNMPVLAGSGSYKVDTINVDDIVSTAMNASPSARHVVVKLDVEGVERQALDGMKATLDKHNTLVVYEDHGQDLTSQVTAHFLERGLNVYHQNRTSGAVTAIRSTDEIVPLKVNRRTGYNFIACKPGSEFDDEFKARCINAQLGQDERSGSNFTGRREVTLGGTAHARLR